MNHKAPHSLEEILKKHHPYRNVNSRHRENLSRLDKLALWITNHVGSMGFFSIIFFWTAFWLSWNTLAPAALRFDPFPAFVLWLFISNMIQIFLMPLIMIGQNLQSKHSELRAEEDYLINKKAEEEIEAIISHLEYQNEIILRILEKVDKQTEKDKK
jgi:uncharacterized membrane protein